jgi:Flp pilus assembly protein CpaB
LKLHPHTTTTHVRSGAINATTVFAVTMAILAGLIFAWVFKVVLLAPKEPPPPPRTYTLTVAAFNLRDKVQILPHQIKTVTVSEEDYQNRVKLHSGHKILTGQQPVFRITRVPLNAEEVILDDQLEPFTYTEPLSSRIKAGMRAVNLRLNSEHCEGGTIRVKDRVDVLCTMTNENFPGASSATAVMAKGVEVIARNDTTEAYDAVNEYDKLGVGFETKSYTIQATPFRASLIDLAKKLGGEFTLVLSTTSSSGDEAKETDALDQKYAKDTVVTTEHLAEVFGIRPPVPERPPWLVEHVVGVKRVGYQGFPPTSQRPTTNGTGQPEKKTTTNGSSGTEEGTSSDATSQAPPRRSSRRPDWANQVRQSSPEIYPTAEAALSATSGPSTNDYGFRPKPKGCPTCGGKKR